MTVEISPHPDGALLPVQAQPKARKNGVVGEHAGALKVAVTQAPEKGKANDALAKVLAEELGLKKSQVRLVSGETSTKKVFLISSISVEELAGRVADCVTRRG